MDRDYVVKHDVVDRYIRGDLSQEDSEAFETFFLDDQETLEELELMTALRSKERSSMDATAARKTRQNPGPGLPTARPATVNAGQGNGGNRRWHVPLTAAASLAVGILISTSFLNQVHTTPDPGSMMLVDIATLRSDDIVEIMIPSGLEYAAFRIAIGAQPYAVDVVLEHGEESIAKIEGLITDTYGDVTFVVPARQLDSGRYRILATAFESNEIVFDNQIMLTRR